MRKRLVVAIVLLLVAVAGCTSAGSKASSTTASSGTSSGSGAGSGSTPAKSGEALQAPGVTATSIKVGVTYVDEAAIKKSGINIKLGDYKDSYLALANQINQAGGINGRKLQLVFAAIDPVGTAPTQAACVKLTQDEKVFVAVGFFLNDTVLCPVETNDTAVIGGSQTPALLQRAKAPWFTTAAGSDLPEQVVRAMKAKGDLNGKVAVYAAAGDADLLNKDIVPLLGTLGVKPVAKGIVDAPQGDSAAAKSQTLVIAQKFKAAGADTVLLVGQNSFDWFYGMEDQPYQPKLLISDNTAVSAFLSNSATTNLSLLKDSVVGGPYGPDQKIYDEPHMQTCFTTLKQAGIAVPGPVASDQNAKQYTGPEDACTNMALLKALLTKAGKDLNYASFRAGGYALGPVQIPGDPSPRTYGPPPATDGSAKAYLSTFDPATKTYPNASS